MRQIWITRVGVPETLEIKSAADPSPADGEVLIDVRASGVNFADIMARLGLYPDAPRLPAVVGYEVSGTVAAVGPNVKAYKTGDRVVGLCRFGGYSDRVCLPEIQVFPLPEHFSFAEGAALPVNYLTAYQMLFVMGGVKPGDRVLIHSAAGGVGLAAIQLCRIAGAEPIGIASEHKHAYLRELGVTALIDSQVKNFDDETLRLSNGRGAQIVLDPVGGNSWKRGFRALAPTGRLVVFGFSAAATGKRGGKLGALRAMLKVPWLEFSPLSLMDANKGVLGVNLGHLWGDQDLVSAWMRDLLERARAGKIKPRVDRQFRFEEAAAAHHYLQDRKNVGKIVLTP